MFFLIQIITSMYLQKIQIVCNYNFVVHQYLLLYYYAFRLKLCASIIFTLKDGMKNPKTFLGGMGADMCYQLYYI